MVGGLRSPIVLICLFAFALIRDFSQSKILGQRECGRKQELENSKRREENEEGSPQYTPSTLEDFVFTNSKKHVMNATSTESMQPMCAILQQANADDLRNYLENLHTYNSLVEGFIPLQEDIRTMISRSGESACENLRLRDEQNKTSNPFSSNQLSYSSSVGGLEPLLPPLRHPSVCEKGHSLIMDLSYMVHDFPAMCKTLKSTSRTVFVDMGASLDFHGAQDMPAMYILNLYKKFGFYFDHIYAYEVTPKEPSQVFSKVPPDFLAAYHWMNVGVESDPQSTLNPLQMIADNFNKDDFIVVKLDIDTSWIEVPLAYQLLRDERLIGLVDQFYFEHHVFLKELSPYWGRTMGGSISESLHLFQSLRKKGVGAHSWV